MTSSRISEFSRGGRLHCEAAIWRVFLLSLWLCVQRETEDPVSLRVQAHQSVLPVTSVNFASRSVQLKMFLLSTSRDHIEINNTTIIEIVTRSSRGGVGATDRN